MSQQIGDDQGWARVAAGDFLAGDGRGRPIHSWRDGPHLRPRQARPTRCRPRHHNLSGHPDPVRRLPRPSERSKWKRQQFHQLAGFLPRVQVKRDRKTESPTFSIVSYQERPNGRGKGKGKGGGFLEHPERLLHTV